MTLLKENDQELLPPSEAVKESLSEYQPRTPETRPEVVEDYKAWLYVLAGFVTYVNVSGTLNSFGVYQAYYQSNRLSSSSPSSISWIGSIQVFIAIGFGIFTGPLYDRGLLRFLVPGGSFLTVFGMMMTSIGDSYYQVFLAQGLCVGVGMGLVYVPILGEVSRHFSQKRPIALGLSSTGACVGGVLFPVLFRQLLPQIGFGWTVRVLAFINFGCGVTASTIVCLGPPQVQSSRRAWDLTAFREMPFTFFTLGMFLVFVPYYVPLTYVPVFAQTAIRTSDDLAGYLLAIVNAGSLLGRTLPYILGFRVTPIRAFVFWIIAAVILLFGWMGVTNTSGLIVWCVFWGIVSGVLATAPIAAVSHPVLTPSQGQLGTRMGMSLMASAIGDLVGPPMMGALIDVRGGHYARAQAVSGAMMTLGGLCMLCPLISIARYSH